MRNSPLSTAALLCVFYRWLIATARYLCQGVEHGVAQPILQVLHVPQVLSLQLPAQLLRRPQVSQLKQTSRRSYAGLLVKRRLLGVGVGDTEVNVGGGEQLHERPVVEHTRVLLALFAGGGSDRGEYDREEFFINVLAGGSLVALATAVLVPHI